MIFDALGEILKFLLIRSRKSSDSSETSTSDKNGKQSSVEKTEPEIEKPKPKEQSPEIAEKAVEKTEKVEEVKGTEDESKVSTPLEELIKAATIMNPRVFELPRELEIFSQFPGEDKSESAFTSVNQITNPLNSPFLFQWVPLAKTALVVSVVANPTN